MLFYFAMRWGADLLGTVKGGACAKKFKNPCSRRRKHQFFLHFFIIKDCTLYTTNAGQAWATSRSAYRLLPCTLEFLFCNPEILAKTAILCNPAHRVTVMKIFFLQQLNPNNCLRYFCLHRYVTFW
ncbi:unnamed protein product [Clavelina lepadiformis]|uniref:Secreted protein n=1 Tax=Clavelina lepadiformis TaxID=159417 RepID=A0ABP0G0E7_CLALP